MRRLPLLSLFLPVVAALAACGGPLPAGAGGGTSPSPSAVVAITLSPSPSALPSQPATQSPQPSPVAGVPAARSKPAMAYDAARKVVVLFGGSGSGGPLSDTWTWNGTGWLHLFPRTSPSPRSSAQMAYDEVRGQVVLFGGQGLEFKLLTDTWTWSGSDWHLETPRQSPDGYRDFAFAFFPPTGKLLLYGTLNGNGFSPRGTWSWDGADWAQLTPADLPPFNVGAGGAMVYMAALKSLLLYGGSDQTWTWDGSDWHYLEGAGPGQRQFVSLALDATGGALVYGGQPIYGTPEAWRWKGGWVAVHSAHVPPIAGTDSLGTAMAYDADTQQTLLVGSNNGTSQTWIWDGVDWKQAVPG